MKKFILILILMLLGAQAKANCNKYLSTENLEATATTTDRFIAYVNKLFTEQMLDLSQLEEMFKKLEQVKQLTNPISKESVNSNNKIHFQALQDYIDSKELDPNQILNWIKIFLKKETVTRNEKAVAKEQSALPSVEMKFYPVMPGEVRQYSLKVDHPFEMTSTPITQHMWVKQMGKNPARFTDKTPAERGDFPIQNITWWSALVYANQMSRSAGLPEVYDLSDLTYVKGNAGIGDLEYKGTIKINAPDGDIYKTKGYRLPTKTELQYVQALTMLADKGLAPEADQYFSGDSFGEIFYPVAEITPFTLAESVFYDLFGHVAYYTSEFTVSDDFKYTFAVTVQGIYEKHKNQPHFTKKLNTGSESSGTTGNNIGIRLVRTLD